MASLLIADISQFQGLVDWSSYGSPAVIVRLCYGDVAVDTQADRNIEGARSRCLVRGWYCYLIAGRDPVAQANVFCKVLQAHGGLQPNEFIVVDDEESNGANEVDRVNAFLAKCDSTLKTPHPEKQDWWYAGLYFAIAHNLSAAKGHRWLAAYMSNEPSLSHDLWQYTSSGRISGVGGNVDLSVFHGTILDLISLINTGSAVRSKSTGGTMALLVAPFAPSRLDLIVVDANGHCAHNYSDGGAGGLENSTRAWDDYGLLPGAKRIVPGTMDVCWDNLNRLVIVAADSSGQGYLKVVRSTDGGIDQDWYPINVRVSIPAPGSYDNTVVESRLGAIEALVSRLKAAFGLVGN